MAVMYLLPCMESCTNSFGDTVLLSKIDCNSSSWQLSVATENRDKTKFTTFWGMYCYLHMPFGLRIVSAVLQRALNIIVSGVS